MTDMKLAVERREQVGKGVARKLRRTGSIPGIVYGPGKEPTPVHTSERDFARVFQQAGHTQLIDLDVAGETKTVLIKAVDRDPVKDDVVHVDFHEVRMDTVIHSSVPILVIGEDSRESDGGILNQSLRELDIKSLPAAIPEHIEIDAASLKVGDTILVSDLKLPEGVETEVDPEEVVVSIVLPAAEVEEDEAGETVEPAVVGEEEPKE